MKYLRICEIRDGLSFSKDSKAASSDVEMSYEGSITMIYAILNSIFEIKINAT